jgi:Uma2 family endonuclease
MIATPHATTERMKLAEFEAYIALPENSDRRLELIDGEIVESMPTLRHNLFSRNLFLKLYLHAEANDLGEVVYETSYRGADDDENYRVPDLGFTTKARLLPVPENGAVPQMPDICIEFQSPDEDPKEMRAKASYYLANGAQEVWLFFTKRPRVEVMYPDGDSEFYKLGDTLTSPLLPGLSIVLADIFRIR